jgi:SAM-dependent methyltransferase
MPTISPDPAPFSAREPHKARQIAESFGADAERYDRARPSYPGEMVTAITAGIPGTDVLDVGIGTGIAARLFLAAGCQVLGVDPDARMAEVARRRGLAVEVGKFEDWDPAGRVFDAVVAGQAWHWVDPDAGAAKAALALRPGGRLAVFWNAFQPPADVAEALAAAFRRVIPGSGDRRRPTGAEAYAAMCEKAADGMRRAGMFGEPEQWRFDWDRLYTRDEFLDQVPTSGFAGRIEPAQMRELLTDVGAAIDALGGSFTMRYTTMTETAVRS